jgi:excisionase family DNA binding protein
VSIGQSTPLRNPPRDGVMSVSEAARRLGRTPRHVYRLIHRGELKAIIESGDWRIREREFSRFLDRCERASAVRP